MIVDDDEENRNEYNRNKNTQTFNPTRTYTTPKLQNTNGFIGGDMNGRNNADQPSSEFTGGAALSPPFPSSWLPWMRNHRGQLPVNLDWAKEMVVRAAPAPSASGCLNSYALAAAAAIEAAWAIETYWPQWHQVDNRPFPSVSAQQIIDCSAGETQDAYPNCVNQGCKGGCVSTAFAWAMKTTAEDPKERTVLSLNWAYRGSEGSCSFPKQSSGVTVYGMYAIPSTDPIEIMSQLIEGPVTAMVDVTCYFWQNYRSGIIDQDCGAKKGNHAILITGYGSIIDDRTNQRLDFWIVRSNQGSTWGNNGYGRILRGKNILAIESRIVRPIVNFQKAQLMAKRQQKADFKTNRLTRKVLQPPPYDNYDDWN